MTTDDARPVAIPERIRGLGPLSENLWWSWQPAAEALYRHLDPVLVPLFHAVHGLIGLLYESFRRERVVGVGRDSERRGDPQPDGDDPAKQGRAREAVEHLRAVVAINPREIDPVINLAAAMRDANMFEESRQVCSAALQMIPDHPEFKRILESLPPPRQRQN